MPDVEQEAPKPRSVRLRVAIIATVLTAAGVGAGGYYVGLQAGEPQTSGPSADLLYQQQLAAVARLKGTTKQLVAIEQRSVQLLTGKSGEQVDMHAFWALREQYMLVYNVFLEEGGHIRVLFSPAVRRAAQEVSQSCVVASQTLYTDAETLAPLTVAQVHAIQVNSHAARKAQWATLRRFDKLATAEMIGEG